MFELIGKVAELLLKLSPEFRSIAVALLAVGGGTYYMTDYVNAKHQEVNEKIQSNERQVNEMMKSQAEIVIVLKSASESLKDVKTTVQKMDDRVWQMYRDTYMIENKNGG